MSRHLLGFYVAVALCVSSAAALAQSGSAAGALPASGRRVGPPPVAVEACSGSSKGDACTILGSYGARISGRCTAVGDKLACVPGAADAAHDDQG